MVRLLLPLCAMLATGCIGRGGAISVRWRIVERETGVRFDPRETSDAEGVCCQAAARGEPSCANQPGWRVTRVRLVLSDPTTSAELTEVPAGLDARCNARELTTPFELDEGTFAINLRGFDPAAPGVVQSESPSPELRDIKPGDIVNLDIVELSVSAVAQP